METEVVHQPKVGRWQRSKELLKSSWRVLKLDKELLTLPIIGMTVGLFVLIFGAILAFVGYGLTYGGMHSTGNGWIFYDSNSYAAQHPNPISKWVLFAVFALVVLAITFVSNFIATAIARGALDRFDGENPSVKSSLRAAKQRVGSIFKFSLLATTVGVIMQIIRERVPFGGRIIAFLGDAAWSIATFFVIPIIAMSEKPVGPIDATKQSIGTIKRVWGESLILDIGIGLIAILSVLVYAPLMLMLTVGSAMLYGPLGLVVGLIGLLGLFAIVLVFNVLAAIVKAAIYYWATTGKSPATFNKDLLRASLTHKKARKIFA